MQLPLRTFLASDIFGLIIDAINISQDTPLERLAQITMMDRIHGSAHFTNVATTGDNSSTGLPGIHSRSCGDTHQPFGGVCGFGLTKVRSSECEELEVSKGNLMPNPNTHKVQGDHLVRKNRIWRGHVHGRCPSQAHGLYDNMSQWTISDFARPGDQTRTGHQLFGTRLSLIPMN
jgi:Heterokaryon incompatibility protein (HET)